LKHHTVRSTKHKKAEKPLEIQSKQKQPHNTENRNWVSA
jgi:hypothetical protein